MPVRRANSEYYIYLPLRQKLGHSGKNASKPTQKLKSRCFTQLYQRQQNILTQKCSKIDASEHKQDK